MLDGDTIITRWTQGGDWDLVGGFRTNSLIDPNDAIEEFVSTNPGVNLTGYDNPEATKLAKEGISTQDQNQRKEIYAKLYKILNKDVPSIPLDYRQSVSAWNARINGADKYGTGDANAAQELAALSIAK